MRRFRDLSIRWKLVAMMTLTSLIGLAVLSGALFSIGVGRYRAWAVIEASSLARIIGAECAEAALAKDADTARRELAMLAAGTTVEGACLYSSDGGLLAQYTRAGLPGRPAPTMRSGGETFADGYLELFRPIKLNGQPVGVIYLRINQEYRRERFEAYVIAGIGVAFVSWLISVVLATRLQRIVSRPIQELVRVARAVMEKGDYSLRAAKLSADETALLTDAFNQVLAQAQKRAHDSQVQRVYLEKRVAERTTELKKANEEMRLLQSILLAVG
ncbi:MAG: HAMP domain-containing protein, partial [Verrucomicrobia bacterium]|nr:HAMP domain-containing protein [Verrucomicrobiota bacterium]